jgi:hypothetical protein
MATKPIFTVGEIEMLMTAASNECEHFQDLANNEPNSGKVKYFQGKSDSFFAIYRKLQRQLKKQTVSYERTNLHT